MQFINVICLFPKSREEFKEEGILQLLRGLYIISDISRAFLVWGVFISKRGTLFST